MRTNPFTLLLIVLLFFHINAVKGIVGKLEKHTFICSGTTLPYQIFLPFNLSEKLPLVIVLHGLSMQGNDNESQMNWTLAQMWLNSSNQEYYPCIALFPQCPANSEWDNSFGHIDSFRYDPVPNCLYNLIKSVCVQYPIDTNCVYITGASFGGHGVWGMIQRYPKLFTAAIPICGYNVYRDLHDISNVPIWIIHGKQDDNVPVNQSREMVSLFKDIGVQFIFPRCNFETNTCSLMSDEKLQNDIDNGAIHFYSEYDNTKHRSFDSLCFYPTIYLNWLFKQNKKNQSVLIEKNNLLNTNFYKTGDFIHLDLPLGLLPATCDIYNILGEKVGTYRIYNSTFTIKANDLKKGIYLIYLKSKSSACSKKVVVN